MTTRLEQLEAENKQLREALFGKYGVASGIKIIEKAMVEAKDLGNSPFPLIGKEAGIWSEATRAAYQHALEMICLDPKLLPAVVEHAAEEAKNVASPLSKLRAYIEESGFPSELAGYAARDAAKQLTQNWECAVADGCKHNLVADVDLVIEQLRTFKKIAQENLPLPNGGMDGRSLDYWREQLATMYIFVYEAKDLPGHFGFTGCESDQYLSEAEATVAAVMQHRQNEDDPEQDEPAERP